jgi:hypothetical protein
MAAAGRMQVSRYVTVIASKWYPHTSLILSIAYKKPYLVLSKGSKLKLAKINPCFGIKTALKEKETLESFAHSKLLALLVF